MSNEWKIQKYGRKYKAYRVYFTDGYVYQPIANDILDETDARLIAAAPEMYEELKELLSWIDTVEGYGKDVVIGKIKAILTKIEA